VTSQTTAEPHGQAGFTLFDTAIGRCGIAWTGPVISAVRLPGHSDAATCAAVLSVVPGTRPTAPPPGIDQVLHRIRNLVAGHCPDALADVPLALSAVDSFERRVYAAAREVLPGETVTYGRLAERIGAPGAARAVGRTLGRNRFPIVVPCHRLVAAGGRLGGFSAPSGTATKRRLLAAEAHWRHVENALW
jgi:methylated-DNA-[protein]-cysteine S-methyltransferase